MIHKEVVNRVSRRSSTRSLRILSLISNMNNGDGYQANPLSTSGRRIGRYANVWESSAVIGAGIRAHTLADRLSSSCNAICECTGSEQPIHTPRNRGCFAFSKAKRVKCPLRTRMGSVWKNGFEAQTDPPTLSRFPCKKLR